MSASEVQMSISEEHRNGLRRFSRAKRPRSAVTSGRELFIDGDPHSAWSRRFHDLIVGHATDFGDVDLVIAQHLMFRRVAFMESELERLEAQRSRGEDVDVDAYGRTAERLRRHYESLYSIDFSRKPKDITPLDGYLHERNNTSHD